MDIANELTAKVMGEILAKGMSLSEVDLSKSVDSEALLVLGKIETALSGNSNQTKKLKEVQKIVGEYKINAD